jgi:hypothetical protein
MKSRDRLRFNVFIITRKIIFTKENASNSMKILELKKFHLQKRKIHLDFYNSDVFYVRMILYKSQKQCVENAKKLIYLNRIVAIVAKIHIVCLKENADFELFINEKKKEIVLMNHEFYVNVDVIFATTRSKFKMSRKFAKHHEFIRRILKKKVEKKRNCSFQKSYDQKMKRN